MKSKMDMGLLCAEIEDVREGIDAVQHFLNRIQEQLVDLYAKVEDPIDLCEDSDDENA